MKDRPRGSVFAARHFGVLGTIGSILMTIMEEGPF